jgi:cation transport ATPase
MNYQLVHSIVGRLRIRISQLAWDEGFAHKLNGLVEQLTFVTNVRINPAASSLIVTYDPEQILGFMMQDLISGCISQALIGESTAIEPIAPTPEEETAEEIELEPQVNRWQDLGLPCLSLGFALLATPLELPAFVVTAVLAGAALPWFMRATDSLVNHRQPSTDLLDSLWMTLQTLQGQYTAPALKTCLVEVRRTLRGTVSDERQNQALEILTWLEQEYWIERDGQTQRIAANAIQSGDRVILCPGERIPVDGWILAGVGWIDEWSLTGASQPVICSEGESVYASTRLVDGKVCILAERTGMHTRAGMVAQHLQSAPIHDTQIAIHQAEFVRAAIVPTIVTGGTIFALTGNLGAAISPFQLDFGSGIPISVHSTLLLALTEAARHGIYIRSARILELLAQVDVVVFDQTELMTQPEQNMESVWQESDGAIAALQHHQITSYWVTSDSLKETQERAFNLGIQPNHVWAEAVPEQVSTLIAALRHQGKTVAYIGEGEYSGALQASVTISVGQTGENPSAMADVVVLNGDLQGLSYAIAIAKRAMEVVYQNTAIIILPNLLVQIGGGILLGMHPVVNVITNNSSALVAEFIHGKKPLFDRLPASAQKRSRRPLKQLPENHAPVADSWIDNVSIEETS